MWLAQKKTGAKEGPKEMKKSHKSFIKEQFRIQPCLQAEVERQWTKFTSN